MDKSEELLQKRINLLPSYLTNHKNVWMEQLKEIPSALQVLTNQSEEFIHVDSVRGLNIDIENFGEVQNKLCIILVGEINLTLEKLMDKINLLKRANNDLKNRIDALEKLFRESYDYLSLKFLNGNEKQPSLSFLLQCCSKYRTFFLRSLENIVCTFSSMDVKRRESVKEFKHSFQIDMEDQDVTLLISLFSCIN